MKLLLKPITIIYHGIVLTSSQAIMLTCPCNVHPLTPRFYIVNLRLALVYFFAYICSKTYIVGTRLNRLTEAALTCTHDLCFEQK